MKIKCNPEKFGVVIVGGGSGNRFGPKSKLLSEIAGKPVFMYSLEAFSRVCPPENIVLVLPGQKIADFNEALELHHPGHGFRLACGGKTRMESVANGLAAVPGGLPYAAIHDAARPLIGPEFILDCFRFAEQHGSAVAARRITDTVKLADDAGIVIKTLDRGALWTVETPQVFDKSVLESAYRKAFGEGFNATDDAGVMEYSRYQVHLMEHSRKNLKITFWEDLKEAEYALKLTQNFNPTNN